MESSSNNDIAVVFGNTGSIGKSIYNQLKKSNKFIKVFGFNRKHEPKINIEDEKSFEFIANSFFEKKLKIKLLVNAIGFLHDQNFRPEKKFQDINHEYIKKSFSVNTLPTAFLIKYFTPLMDNNDKSIFAILSAKVGSISDNYLGGWYGYRASKAALNQLVKTASIEYKRKNKKLIIVSLHPGTVSTQLSKPFLGNRKVFSPDEASVKIVNVLDSLSFEDTGYLFDYNKNIIPY